MTARYRLLLLVFSLVGASACDMGPNGYGTAPPGVSQADWDRQIEAKRKAKRALYQGPRGGATGR